jgi:hypothetical protein
MKNGVRSLRDARRFAWELADQSVRAKRAVLGVAHGLNVVFDSRQEGLPDVKTNARPEP